MKCLNLSSLSFGLLTSAVANTPNYCSFILHEILSKKYGMSDIHIENDSDFSYADRFKVKHKDVILQIAHADKGEIWNQTLHCNRIMFRYEA